MKTLHVILLMCFCHQDISAQIQGRPFVSGGYRTAAQEVPWHVGVYKKTIKSYKQICGGTIITKNAILTAAHCFSADRNIPSAHGFAVAAGKLYRNWNDPNDTRVQKANVSEIHIPPRYQGSLANFQDDLALALLDRNFTFNLNVEPVCLNFLQNFDRDQLKEGQLGKVVGWGLTGPNENPPKVLQAAMLPSIPIEKCIEQSPVTFRSSITGDKICAGHTNGTAVCRGDSGGGLVFSLTIRNTRRNYIRGVVSTSPTSSNKCNIYTWATFTHVPRHEAFIKSIVPDVEKSCVTQNLNYQGQTKEPTGACYCPC